MSKVKKCWHHLLLATSLVFFVSRQCQKIEKIDENWWKLANVDREFLHIFWTTWRNSMKFSGKMCLKIILKVTKNQGFSISLEDTLFENHWGGRGGQIDPPAVLGLKVLLKVLPSFYIRVQQRIKICRNMLFAS